MKDTETPKNSEESAEAHPEVQPDRRKLIKRMAQAAVAVPVVTVLHDVNQKAKAVGPLG